MLRLFKDTKGAVTIFVTLLLIPAILVSGTAVDLSRIYTARSIVQDSNQLAANSVLTQYDALIQDIYGLYGVMEEDPILGDMLNEYIKLAVFGEDSQDKEPGSFELFYGSNLQSTSAIPASNKNLSDPNVLRRQIEEYAKFRAPVIIVNNILDSIGEFKKLKSDAEAIEKKMDIDEKIGEVTELYEEIYELINSINTYSSKEKDAFNSINEDLRKVNIELKELEKIRKEWTDAFNDGDDDESLDDLERQYNEVKNNIKNYTKGLDKKIEVNVSVLNSYLEEIDKLIKLCKKVDDKKKDLGQKIDELEDILNNKNCSDKLVKGMTEPVVATNKEISPSMIEQYRNLFDYLLKPMAENMQNTNGPYIEKAMEIIKNVEYGSVEDNVLGDPRITRTNLKDQPGHIFDIDNIVTEQIKSSGGVDLKDLAKLTDYKYDAPNRFVEFQNKIFDETHNKEFYEVLANMLNSNGNKAKKEKAKKSINKLLKKSQELYKTQTFELQGAKYYHSDMEDKTETGFGNEGDWEEDGNAHKQTKEALNNSLISKIGDSFDSIGNRILLVTYDTEMFSNFTTKAGTVTMSGIPMDTNVNYFFQSELEYLYNGNEKSAISNITTVAGLVFLVRFVFNYVSTFAISSVNDELSKISSVAGPYAILVRELARAGYALAESAIDMKKLLATPNGGTLLFKTKVEDWTFSLGSLLEEVPDILSEFTKEEESTDSDGMYYIDYLRILLLIKNQDVLAERTADLIGWNITNKKNNIGKNGPDEKTMSMTELCSLDKYHTDFTITTTVDLRMLFLSMNLAQKGINRVRPPKTMEIIATDYRGY